MTAKKSRGQRAVAGSNVEKARSWIIIPLLWFRLDFWRPVFEMAHWYLKPCLPPLNAMATIPVLSMPPQSICFTLRTHQSMAADVLPDIAAQQGSASSAHARRITDGSGDGGIVSSGLVSVEYRQIHYYWRLDL